MKEDDSVVRGKSFQRGDVVSIRSGSPRMTIAQVRKSRALCVCFPYGGCQVIEAWVPLVTLEKK